MNKRRNIVHECGEPLCHRIVDVGKRYCEQHEAEHNQAWIDKRNEYRKTALGKLIAKQKTRDYDADRRDEDGKRLYHSAAWRRVRDAVYARDTATCQVCGEVVNDRKIVDHVVPRRLCGGWGEMLKTQNLWVLCYRCHAIKTDEEQRMAETVDGDAVLKGLSREWWIERITNIRREQNERRI